MGQVAWSAGGWRPAREIATREPEGSEWSISRPALALPPPTGTATRPRRPSTSHVIPLRLIQTWNLRRWNCNVFGASRKMTTINYVRNLGGGGVVAARGYCSQALPLPVDVKGASWGSCVLSFWGALVRVVTNVVNWRCFSCGFLPCCYKRRQSEGFFAENAGFWAQIDDVCNRGPREVI